MVTDTPTMDSLYPNGAGYHKTIQKRAEAATEGPWELVPTSTLYMDGKQVYGIRVAGRPGSKLTLTCFPADAEFIAAARTDVPALLAVAEKAVAWFHSVDTTQTPEEAELLGVVDKFLSGCDHPEATDE
jgi:hypothetical protein